MIHWKVSVLSIALGAAATAGLVWLGRSPLRRLRSPVRSSELAPDEVARVDALRDLDRTDSERSELEFAVPADIEPDALEPFTEETLSADEPYDAVDPESIGAEFLRRATESPSTPSAKALPLDEGLDAAQELPVGSVDTEGNTELHGPDHAAQVAVDLLPNDEELAQRRANEQDPGDTGKPNG